MLSNLASAFEADQLDRLVSPLRALAEAAPEGYSRWAELARQGAAAAAKHDREGVRAACGTCHETHRRRFRDERRTRPLPAALTERP